MERRIFDNAKENSRHFQAKGAQAQEKSGAAVTLRLFPGKHEQQKAG
jgi:hypothetical protein